MQNEPTNNQEPNTNPNTDTNAIMEGKQDWNLEILACLGALSHLSPFFRVGDHLRQSLAEALDTITNTIYNAQGALYNIISYREYQSQFYSNGLGYQEVKKLKITKDHFFHYSGTLAMDWFHP